MNLKWQEVITLDLVSAFFNRIRIFNSAYMNPGKKSSSRTSHNKPELLLFFVVKSAAKSQGNFASEKKNPPRCKFYLSNTGLIHG
jgi:hypothetical protein